MPLGHKKSVLQTCLVVLCRCHRRCYLVRRVFAEHDGKDALPKSFAGVAAVLAAVDEHILLAAVSVQVTVHDDLSLFQQPTLTQT